MLRLLLAPVHAAQHRQAGGDVNVIVGNLRLLSFRVSVRSTETQPQMPHNKQLQRTVTRRRVRAAGAALRLCACGAHDMSARGR
jgi:hypothetical protein